MIDRRSLLVRTGTLAAVSAVPWLSVAARAAGTLKVASLKFGSLNWLLETIKAEKLAETAGVSIEVVEVATNQAGPIALLSGDADVVVSDWTWAMRQRSMGEKLLFRPYSSSLGAVVVPKDSPAKTLADLEGKRIGVAGSAIDKSWIVARAYARSVLGRDLADMAAPSYGAAPLIAEELKNGRIDACLNFWTFAARLEGQGYRPLIGVDDMLQKLGVEPVPALVGFVWKETTEAAKKAELDGFFKAISAGNALLATSDPAFERIRPLTKAASDAEFFALKAYYRAGIPKGWSEAHTAAAEKLFDLLVANGGQELVGSTKFDPKLFDGARDR
ncbi:MAG: ABC transporter substrate-binding protein [Hyphomicrobiaceae bacterium]